MKKLILSVTMSAGFSLASFGQGYMTFDGSNNSNPSPTATTSGLVFINGVLDTGTDINAELLYGTSPYFFNPPTTPVVTLLLSSSATSGTSALGQTLTAGGDITFFANGTLYDVSGSVYQIPNIPGGSTAYFQVEAWSGNYSSYNQALFYGAFTGVTPVFSEVLSSATYPIQSNIGNMPALNLTGPIPEPATYALATGGASLASMLIFRRRKS